MSETAAALRLRPATVSDARRLWEWRNEEETRAASFSTAMIPWEDHVRWFQARLEDPSVRFLVAVDAAGSDVGYARLDVDGTTAEISLSIDRAHRGRSLGTAVIRAAAAYAIETLGVAHVDARVKADNARSAAAFARAGFTLVDRREVNGVETLALRYARERAVVS